MLLKILVTTLLCSTGLCFANGAAECAHHWNVEQLLELDERDIGLAACDPSPATQALQGPRGTRAKWTLPGASIAGLPLATTLFVSQGRVKRIEQTWTSNQRDCNAISGLNLVTSALREKYGNPTASNVASQTEASEETNAWVANDTALASYLQRSPERCLLRLVWQRHQTKDATEL